MSHPDDELRKAVALFRYGLIADVLPLPPGSREIRLRLREKAQRTYITLKLLHDLTDAFAGIARRNVGHLAAARQ